MYRIGPGENTNIMQ